MKHRKLLHISVDVETSGPIPGMFSLLQIGACDIEKPAATFSCILKPLNDAALVEALKVTGLSLDILNRDGLRPKVAMQLFGEWVAGVSKGCTPVFVGLNVGFDWSFVNYYFHRYLGNNPFGHSSLDIKSLYMGSFGCSWDETSADNIASRLGAQSKGDHDALHDALFQAELFRLIRQNRVH